MQAGREETVGVVMGGRVVALHDALLAAWYADAPESVAPGADLESIVRAQHFCNFVLWGLEDEARRRDVDGSYIAETKRGIDDWNQRRNDLVERIDELIVEAMDEVDLSRATLHSETAGMMMDRLSILALKIRNMGVYAESDADAGVARECLEKQALLRVQRGDLAACLEQLIEEYGAGTRYFKVYRQFKAYNDPRLNPAVRRSGAG